MLLDKDSHGGDENKIKERKSNRIRFFFFWSYPINVASENYIILSYVPNANRAHVKNKK